MGYVFGALIGGGSAALAIGLALIARKIPLF